MPFQVRNDIRIRHAVLHGNRRRRPAPAEASFRKLDRAELFSEFRFARLRKREQRIEGRVARKLECRDVFGELLVDLVDSFLGITLGFIDALLTLRDFEDEPPRFAKRFGNLDEGLLDAIGGHETLLFKL